MPRANAKSLDERLREEAERRNQSVDELRDALVRRGLDASDDERRTAADIVLVTVGNTETDALEDAAKAFGLGYDKIRGRRINYRKLGMVGTNRVVAMKVEMGAFSPTGAAASCIEARAETGATTIILIGTAFGIDPVHQLVGNVLVSESVYLYDDRRIVDPTRPGTRYEVKHPAEARIVASGVWLDRFRQLDDELRQDGESTRVEIGVILSGGARIESAVYRDELVRTLPSMDPPIVGGEMEGAGAVSAALSDGDDPGWLIVKGISDFADAESRANINVTRPLAAKASAAAVLRVLQLPPRSV
ncbi:MAG TPA: hypothetical protein VGM88_23215 [Kofleriaceae bacterium]